MTVKNYHLDKYHIISSTESIVEEIVRSCHSMKDEYFFKSNGHWSVAENLEHLRLSFYRSWQGLFLPKFILNWKFGKPTHDSLPYEELQEVYREKLSQGAKAGKRFIPKIKTGSNSKDELIEQFRHTTTRYLNEIRYYWEDEHIDRFQLPHPVLGLITARELMYFNIFHCWHHFSTIRRRKEDTF
jgi:hypothetical protein